MTIRPSVQPSSLPLTMPQTSASRPAVASTMPSRSSLARSPRLSCTTASTSGTATMPTGMLIQKIHSQSSPSTTAPPTTGPSAIARPLTADQRPSAKLRIFSGTALESRVSESGMTAAAPKPWIARAAINWPLVSASPQPIEESVNSTMPSVKTLRCPNRSPSAAPVSSRQAKLRT
ncbi:hypothetical protein ASE03_16895 [Kitasatospora sp. Root187]|nr:hypothetical protein ASE03_16895 [Kitasatospora sp. Root187]